MATLNLTLCYHALSPTWDAALSTTPERFERQMRLLRARGYRATTFSDAVAAAPGSGIVAVTFDDAFASVVEFGFPILQRLGMVATLFVPTDFIDAGGPLRWSGIDQWLDGPTAAELTPASWAQISSLVAAGWEVGSHTASHPRLPDLDDASLADELERSKRVCEDRLGIPCASLAYPYGAVDPRVVTATATARYRTAALLSSFIDRPEPLSWPRIGIYRIDDERRFRMKVSPTVIKLRGTSAWAAVSASRATRRHKGSGK